MFRLWFKLFSDNRMIKDTVIEDNSGDTRTHKVFHALDEACLQLQLEHPLWLESNISDFRRFSKVRFTQDSFINPIPFDYMEMQVIEED